MIWLPKQREVFTCFFRWTPVYLSMNLKQFISSVSLENEVWKPVANTGENYYISNKGRLITGNWKNTGRPAIMKPAANKKGYLKTVLKTDSGNKSIYIHRLVCTAFIENDTGKSQINHKDFNPSNNCVENLEWCTSSENSEHRKNANRYKWNGIIPPVKNGSSNGLAKLTEQQVIEIRSKFKPRIYTRAMLAKEYGVSPHTIKDAILRRWKHVPTKQSSTKSNG